MDKKKPPPRGATRMMARRIVPKELPKQPERTQSLRGGTMRIVVPPTLKTRQQWHWRRLARVPWLRLGAFLATVIAIYVLLGSGRFSVRKVEAVGAAGLPVRLLQQQCRCIGGNIFLLRPDSVRQRLARIPTLVVDDVYGRLPDLLVVQAHFKTPRMIWRARNGYFVADDHGELIARAASYSPLPVVVLRRTQRAGVGQYIDTDAMATVSDLIRYLPPSLRTRVSGFYYSPISGITMAISRRVSATFGHLTGPSLQGRVIILQWALRRAADGQMPRFNYIDLRYSVPYARHNARWLDPQWPR